MLHFIRAVEECWNSWVWEATNRAKDMTPDVATYINMRPLTVALYPCLALLEIAEGIALPPEVWEHSVVRELELRTSSAVGWANDIISLKKELAEGESHNLVLLLHSQEGLPLQKAVERVAQMHDCQVKAFIALEQQLPSFGGQV
jgi:5-epi-alpha-selinene synthase